LLVADASKLRATTGREPAITTDQTLADVLGHWRAVPAGEGQE